MRSFGRLSLTTAVLLATTALASAADIIPAPMPEPLPEVTASGHATGWYLRGDIGYSDLKTENVVYYQGSATLTGAFEREDIDETWVLSGGIGYQATDYFRVDATVGHHFDTDFTGASAIGVTNCGTATGVCDYSDTTELSVTTLMANAYVDLGNFNGITPYVGAGIGGAHVEWKNMDNNEICVSGDCTGSPGDSIHPGNAEWRFAWAVHAGASYDLRCDLKLDGGYTYTRIEGGKMFDFEAGNINAGPQGFDGDLEMHTGRIGLRYQLGGCDTPTFVPETPIYK